MRLIDADTLRKDVEKDRDASDMPKMWYQGVEYAINHIIHAPTVDAEPVRHGRWEWNDYGGFGNYHCTVCRHIPYGKFPWKYRPDYMYCPHCGAKMDEVEE